MSRVAKRFGNVKFKAFEPVAEYVRYAREKYATENRLLDYREGVAETIDLPDKSVSAAYSINIWHSCGSEAVNGCGFVGSESP